MADEETPVEEPFRLVVSVSGVTNLPAPLATRLQVLGLGSNVTSQPAEAQDDRAAGGWAFGEGDEERADVELVLPWSTETCSLLLREELQLVLQEDGKPDPITRLSVDLRQLIHERTELGGSAVVPLAEDYAAMWEPAPPEDPDEPPPPPPEDTDTVLSWKVSAPALLGPAADREGTGAWTCLEVEVAGLTALPPVMALGTQGGANPPDPEAHPLQYSVAMLGMSWAEGALTRAEVPEEPEESAPEPQASVLWAPAGRTEYRGTVFLERFRGMLDRTGGVWLKLTPEAKGGLPDPGGKPAKGAPTGPSQDEVDAAIEKLSAKVFVDLRGFMHPGTRSVDLAMRLDAEEFVMPEVGELAEDEEAPDEAAEREKWAAEKPYAAAGTELRVRVTLRDPIVPPLAEQPPELQIPDVLEPIDQENAVPMAGCAAEAAAQLDGALQSALKVIGGAGIPGATKEQLLEHLRQTGAYSKLRDELRDALTLLARERVRGDRRAEPPAATAGGAFSQEACARVLAELYVVAQDNAVGLVESAEPPVPVVPGGQQEARALDVLRAAASTADTARLMAYELEVLAAAPPSFSDAGPPDAAFSRAAEQWQTQLVLASGRSAIDVWRGYARFCARVGRREAAEEALQHLIYSKAGAAESSINATVDNPEVDAAHPVVLRRFLKSAEKSQLPEYCDLVLNYAVLLLDRGRFAETERAVRAVLDADRSDPLVNLCYALLLWLRCQAGQGEPDDPGLVGKFVSLSRKPLDFFKGLVTDKQCFDKLRLFDREEVSDSDEEKRAPTLVLTPPPEEVGGCRFARLLIEWGAPRLAMEMLAAQPPDGSAPFPALTPNTKVACPLVSHLRARSVMRQRDWPKARAMTKDLVYAKYVDDDGQHHQSPQLWADYAECLYWLDEDPAAAAAKAQDVVESLLPPEFAEPASPVPGYRAGTALLARGAPREALPHFLSSIRTAPTAIAWYGVGLTAYRLVLQGDGAYSQTSFEALTEAMVRNSEHPESWALLALWHCRAENADLAKYAFTTMMSKPYTPDLDFLLEVGWAFLVVHVPFSFAAARRALALRDEGQAHWLLGEAWVADENPSQGVLEMAIAIGMLWEDVEQRQKVYDRGLSICDQLQDAPLRESVHFAQKKAGERLDALKEEEERARRRATAKRREEEGTQGGEK